MGLFILDHYCDSYAHWIKLKLDSKSLLPIPEFSLVITVYDNSYYRVSHIILDRERV